MELQLNKRPPHLFPGMGTAVGRNNLAAFPDDVDVTVFSTGLLLHRRDVIFGGIVSVAALNGH